MATYELGGGEGKAIQAMTLSSYSEATESEVGVCGGGEGGCPEGS
jgi:hypothetical protein